jgi:hypothetical protein
MPIRKRILFRKFSAILLTALYLVACNAACAKSSPDPNAAWNAVDKHIAPCVYQVNVAIEVKLNGANFAQLADLSPRRHYPVFIITHEDQGYRVIGHGTCFPVHANKPGRTYLLTNKHVVDFGEGMVQECERFFTGMRMYAERSAGFANPDQRFKDLQRIVNFATKKNMTDTERTMYQATVDTIWDMYDDHLSLRADPERKEFNRCLAKIAMKASIGYFVHAPGSLAEPALVAELYKQAHHQNQPDLAILAINKTVPALDLDPAPPVVGQAIQAVGYPAVTAPAKGKPAQQVQYAPSFTTGKITRVQPMQIHFDATVSKGDSGGPLINKNGKVLGVVARRAMPDVSTDRYAGAISVLAVKTFAPELFGRP